MIKNYFGINFDAIVVASLFGLIFFLLIYKFKIVDFLVEKIIYPIIIFLINIYNFFDNLFKNEKDSTNSGGNFIKFLSSYLISTGKPISFPKDLHKLLELNLSLIGLFYQFLIGFLKELYGSLFS